MLALTVPSVWGCRERTSTSDAIFPVLNAAGSPKALGLQHGRAFAVQINRSLDFYLRWLSRDGRFSSSELLDVAVPFGEVLAAGHSDLLEEIEGIAAGSGHTVEEILLLNARTDMLIMLDHAARTAGSAAVPGCTAVALRHRKSSDQSALALGQTWDWHVDQADVPVILRLRPNRGPALITLTEAGMLGKIGFNEHGLGVCLNFLSHDSEETHDSYGIPVHGLLRSVMGCATLAEAEMLIRQAPRSASANFLIAQHRGATCDAVDLEWTPQTVRALPMRHDVLVHANHFKDAQLSPGGQGQTNPSSIERDRTARRLATQLASSIPDPVARLRRILESREKAPVCISRDRMFGTSSATLAGIVMDLSRDRLWVTKGPPHRATWVETPRVGSA